MTWGEAMTDQLDFYWNMHLWPRLQGLTDNEYWWEPVGGCWSLRRDERGSLKLENAPVDPPVAPVTTIAWRIVHIGLEVLGTRARAFFGDPSVPESLRPPSDTVMYDPLWWPEPLPATAEEALAFLQKAYGLWRDGVTQLDEEALRTRLGPKGDHHAEQSMGQLVLHINREVMAHGAEVCLLRDLYRAQHDQLDPLVKAARTGDAAEVSRLLGDGVEVPPSLLVETAGLGHWSAVSALVEHGADVTVGNPSALHYAAAWGQLEAIDLLLRHGADPSLKDAQFGMPPGVWARHSGHEEAAAALE